MTFLRLDQNLRLFKALKTCFQIQDFLRPCRYPVERWMTYFDRSVSAKGVRMTLNINPFKSSNACTLRTIVVLKNQSGIQTCPLF